MGAMQPNTIFGGGGWGVQKETTISWGGGGMVGPVRVKWFWLFPLTCDNSISILS